MFGWRTSRGNWSTFALQCMYNVTNMECRLPLMLVLWLGREFYRGMYGKPRNGDIDHRPWRGIWRPFSPKLPKWSPRFRQGRGRWLHFPGIPIHTPVEHSSQP
ncbi:hypothetical protein AVEN_26137-1 [Araneus ventricosus]|uniref:Uncharacterized protein n=1 Tax=Araneus ventricosus TaxID=182803 RepID=A0A4Y2VWX3_ARAVE|nr:hypothetical protein AVEN_26137-1 [Araneus ventricosus]